MLISIHDPISSKPNIVIVSNINNQLMRLMTVYKMELLEDCEYINLVIYLYFELIVILIGEYF